MAGRYGVSTSMMLGANAAFVLLADEVALTRPLNAIRERIDAAAPR